MFKEKHYVPILKWKMGEKTALEEIPTLLKNSFTPLVEIVPPTFDFAHNVYKKSIDDHLRDIGSSFAKSWSSQLPFFIDLKWLPLSMSTCFGIHTLEYVLNEIRKKSYKAIPVTGSSRDLAYQNEVKRAIAIDKLGVCFRIEEHDFVHIDNNIKAMLSFFSVQPEEVDLIIDFDYILDKDNNKNYLSIIALINSLPFISQWRTFTFSASAFPEDTSLVSTNTIGSFVRSEWLIWNALYKNSSSIKRVPSFGDYAIANPKYKEIDPRLMKMTANIRYTANSRWIIVKGLTIKKNGWKQTQGLCKKLIALKEYCGRSFSWGDKTIDDCANGVAGCGNATTWRKVGTNHHITLVVNQLSNLP